MIKWLKRKINLLFSASYCPHCSRIANATTAKDIEAIAAFNRRNLHESTRPIAEIEAENDRLVDDIASS